MKQPNIDIVTEVTELIKKGLIKGYTENILFTDNYTDLQSRVIEYLIVVNIAQQLKSFAWENCIRINLEYSLNNFYNNAFPEMIFTGATIFDQAIKRRQNHTPNDSKSKRVDIVLTKDLRVCGAFGNSQDSLIGIEVKAINQHDKKIKQDVVRLGKAMMLRDEIGGNNIVGCFICFFRRLDLDNVIISKDEIKNGITLEFKKWQKYFNEGKSMMPGLNFELIDLNIVDSPGEYFKPDSEEQLNEYSEIAELSGHVNAYIIKITRSLE